MIRHMSLRLALKDSLREKVAPPPEPAKPSRGADGGAPPRSSCGARRPRALRAPPPAAAPAAEPTTAIDATTLGVAAPSGAAAAVVPAAAVAPMGAAAAPSSHRLAAASAAEAAADASPAPPPATYDAASAALDALRKSPLAEDFFNVPVDPVALGLADYAQAREFGCFLLRCVFFVVSFYYAQAREFGCFLRAAFFCRLVLPPQREASPPPSGRAAWDIEEDRRVCCLLPCRPAPLKHHRLAVFVAICTAVMGRNVL